MKEQLFNYTVIGNYIIRIITAIITIYLLGFIIYLTYKLIKFLISV